MPVRTIERRPHVHAQSVDKTSGDGSGTTEVTTKWKPHVIIGIARSDDGVEGVAFLCGENDSGTMLYFTTGHDSGTTPGSSTSGLVLHDSGGNGWTATVEFHARGYTITWAEAGSPSGMNAEYEFVAVHGAKAYYVTDGKTAADSSEEPATYSSVGFDPDLIFVGTYLTGSGETSVGVASSSTTACAINLRHGDNSLTPGTHPSNFAATVNSSINGWILRNAVMGSDQFQFGWYKSNSGATVDAYIWAIKFDDWAADNYTGDPTDTTDIISGEDFTPLVTIRAGRWNASAGSFGIQTENRSLVIAAHAWQDYDSYSGEVGHQGASGSIYYATDHVLTSGNVEEDVTIVTSNGSPSGGSGQQQQAHAFGENSGAGGVEDS